MRLTFRRDNQRRELEKERRKLTGARAAALMIAAARNANDNEDSDVQKYLGRFNEIETRIEQIESELLLLDAYELGVEFPTKEEKPDWWTSDSNTSWLSEKAQIHLNKLVRKERRENIAWWVNTLSMILGLLIGVLG